jgi:hypothetical protein
VGDGGRGERAATARHPLSRCPLRRTLPPTPGRRSVRPGRAQEVDVAGIKERLSKRRDERKTRRKERAVARATDPRKLARRTRIDEVEAGAPEMGLWSPKDH